MKRRLRNGTACVALFGLAAQACTMAVPELKVKPVSSYASTAEKDGLRIAVHPTTDAQEMEDTFRVNLLEKGLLPVLVVVENNSPSTSYIVARENVTAASRDATATAGGGQPKIISGTEGGGVALAGAILVSLPLLIVAMKMSSDAQIVQYNLSDKALYSRTLDPGQTTSGYVYVTLPKEASGERYEMTLRAVDASGGGATVLTLPIPYGSR